MLFRAEKAKSYPAYCTRLAHGVVEIWVEASGRLRCTIGLREKTLPGPTDNWMRAVRKSPHEDFLKSSLDLCSIFLFCFTCLLFVFWDGLLGRDLQDLFYDPPPRCPRVIERWVPGALRQVGDRCLGMLGTGVE